ncbi:hypothetical protein J2I47_01075 [Fibrella sp. HMF5335]|uniref:Aerotolerance regulator N-terminal domain-containing protein n=1 Tax=Fibrella rubiginis TaxID=2817060 RepID=A0A939G9V1_9BACT|nr:hypothetical protein [Fibrella rubiginis]MBO0935127.1 hypothetical protein [Fibrella rubiginis]
MPAPTDWTTPWPWLIAALLLALSGLSVWFIGRHQHLSAGRKWVRIGLHGLLLLALLGLFLQPRWRSQLPAGRVLLVADDVPSAVVRRMQDSLNIREAIRAKKFRGAADSVTLLGGSFSDQLLAQLAERAVTWVPYDAANQLKSLRWEGIVQVGQNQTVSGRVNLPEADVLRLKFGKRAVDSTQLAAGDQSFTLKYPVFSLGRNSPTLWLGNTLLDTLHFVVRPTARMRIRFVLTAPDFETRTLADWLGQQGHQVELTNTLSKGIGSSTSINSTALTRSTPPDLIITDPGNVSNVLVNKALLAGKSVLVLNLGQPETDVAAINRALHTRWHVKRVPGKDTLHVGPSLTALPYRFVSTAYTLPVPGYPVAIQPAPGHVAVSLLTETFPLRLGGDSTAYSRLWLSVLARLQPTALNNLLLEQPVYQHVSTAVTLNNPSVIPTQLRLGSDTIQLRAAPVNARSWTGFTRPTQSGWQTLQDTLAVYVYPTEAVRTGALTQLAQRQKTAAVALAHRRYDTKRTAETRFIEKEIPDLVWFALIVTLLAALWIEPKLS